MAAKGSPNAQHAVAKEYGFATWAELKSHVVRAGMTPEIKV